MRAWRGGHRHFTPFPSRSVRDPPPIRKTREMFGKSSVFNDTVQMTAAVAPVTLAEIEAARARLVGRVRTSPCARSRFLSEATGANVLLKLENLQLMGSFKERGAC